MGKHAGHVYTAPASIQQLEELIAELPANGHVAILLKDGSRCEGIISTRPNVQVFRDEDGVEGLNAELRLEQPGKPLEGRQLWLDQIAGIEHLNSTMGGEN